MDAALTGHPRANLGFIFARLVLLTLVGIHFVLPFTPVNRHEEQRIIVASLILGLTFSSLGLVSFKKPYKAFAVSLVILLAVYVVSAMTGASPLREGIVVKVLFAAGLVCGIIGARDGTRGAGGKKWLDQSYS